MTVHRNIAKSTNALVEGSTSTGDGLNIPVRTCQCCGKPFYRRKYESWTLYENRKYCGNTCRHAMLLAKNETPEARAKASELRRYKDDDYPEKYCEYCGKRLVPRHTDAKRETLSNFKKRKYCNRGCQAKGAAIKNRAKPHVPRKAPQPPEGYRQCISHPEKWCSRDGHFWRNGKAKKVTRTHSVFNKHEYRMIIYEKNRIRHRTAAAQLVAEAWIPGFTPDKYILYKDDDPCNYHASNLMVVDKKAYFAGKIQTMLEHNPYPTYDDQVKIIARTKKELLIVEHYFKTADFTPLHKYVNDEFYASLCEYCIKTLNLGFDVTHAQVPNVIAHVYDILLQGHAVTDLTRYCAARLDKYRRTGSYGYLMYIPRKIELLITENLDLDALWQKYKVSKTTKK